METELIIMGVDEEMQTFKKKYDGKFDLHIIWFGSRVSKILFCSLFSNLELPN